MLEHQMLLRIFDTQLGAQGMEDICEIWHCLVSFLPQCGPFGIQVVIASDGVVLFLNSIPKGSTRFIEKIQHIFQQVQDILQKSNDKYKQRHDQHRVPHKFQVGEKVWLHLLKKNALHDPI